MSTSQEQSIFLALADPTRRLIIQRLSEEAATATRLSAGLSITRQAVTKHLNTLVHAGLLTSRVEGRERQYMLRPEPLQEIAVWIAQIEAQWDARLNALHRHLMQQEPIAQRDEASEHSC
jgi:DNA-binding transcriptional ArsR family regulator